MNPHHETPVPSRQVSGTIVPALAVVAATVALVGMRLHGFSLPLETDECNYAYIGARLLEGDRLYVDVWDHQPFGVFVLFAGVMALFGDSPQVFRWMVVVFSLISMLLLYGLLRRAHGVFAGTLGAVLFAVVSSDPGTGGEGCNRELYMNTFIVLAWYLVVAAPLKRSTSSLLAGASLALGSAVKPVVAVPWLALAVWLFVFAPAPAGARRRLRDAALLAAGPLLLWIATTAYFAATGRFSEFVDAVFGFNLGYSEADDGRLGRFLGFFTPDRHPFVFDSAWWLWWFGAAGTAWLIVRTFLPARVDPAMSGHGVTERRHAAAIASLVLASFVAVCLPGRFWPHYYYLMIPPMVLAAAMGGADLAAWASRFGARFIDGRIASRSMHLVVFLVVTCATFWTQYRDYLSQDPLGITIKRYNSRDFWGRGQGRNVGSVTEPGDTIFVYSNDASIYYYSKRRCASRFTMITGLSGDLPGAAERREILIRELESDPPRLILVLFDEPPFPAWQEFLKQHYREPIGWDFHDKTGEPIMFVLCRKDRPVAEIDWNWDRSMIGQE